MPFHIGPAVKTIGVAAMLALACSSACGQAEEQADKAAALQIYSLAIQPAVARTGQPAGENVGDPAKGKTLYETYCVSCHGPRGKGDGPAAAILNPRPRDHTSRAYMSTLTDEYLASIIKEGGAALGRSPAMPAAKTLTDEDIDDLIARIRSLAQ